VLGRDVEGTAEVGDLHLVDLVTVQCDHQVDGRSLHPQARLDQRDCAAVSLLGLQPGLIKQVARDYAVYDLQPCRLQLKATSLSWPPSPQRRRRKPWARMPRSRKASKPFLTNYGRPVPAAA